MNDTPSLSAHGIPIEPEFVGPLRDSAAACNDGTELRRRLKEDGYLYVPGALDVNAVRAARGAILERLAFVGEISDPHQGAVSSGESKRAEMVESLGEFWQSLCEHPKLRAVTHRGAIQDLMRRIFDADTRSFDFLWLRAMHPGRASAYHFDHVYMNRGTDKLLTVWTPLGDVALDEGPLAIVEGSHTWEDLIEEYRGLDVDQEKSRPGHVTLDPVGLVKERNTRLLSAHFRAGDVVIMPMFTLHGSLDNRSASKRVRLSADTRHQPANEPIDERWVGVNPIGHGGGYGSMSGAQPAVADPLFR